MAAVSQPACATARVCRIGGYATLSVAVLPAIHMLCRRLVITSLLNAAAMALGGAWLAVAGGTHPAIVLLSKC